MFSKPSLNCSINSINFLSFCSICYDRNFFQLYYVTLVPKGPLCVDPSRQLCYLRPSTLG
jgi:hypothetical protein